VGKALPYYTMDVVLYGLNHGMPAARVAEETGLTADQVERVFQDIRSRSQGRLFLYLTVDLNMD
jgi:NAD+ synthase